MSSSESLFEHGRKTQAERDAPLAERMRPGTFEEFVGQDQIVDPDRVLLKSIAAGHLPSLILWGPPGSGSWTGTRTCSTRSASRSCGAAAASQRRSAAFEAQAARARAAAGACAHP